MSSESREGRHFPIIPAVVEHGRVVVWRFPKDISQSRLGGRIQPSNACTLITLKLAEMLHRSNIRAPLPPTIPAVQYCAETGEVVGTICEIKDEAYCSPKLLLCFVNAILCANDEHEKAVAARRNGDEPAKKSKQKNPENFTIPDAIKACGGSFRELDFVCVRCKICQALPRYLKAALRHPILRKLPRLFFVMIAYERSVLIVYERTTDSFAVFDSHMHWDTQTGSLIAISPASNPRTFAGWLSENVFPESSDKTSEFEISLLHFTGVLSSSDCVPPPPFEMPHRVTLFNPTARVTSLPMTVKRSSAAAEDGEPPSKRSHIPDPLEESCDIIYL